MLTPDPGVDLLTRTTIQVNGSMTAQTTIQVVQALKRVPGVLLAEVDAAGTRAIVAHDPAVPTASLLMPSLVPAFVPPSSLNRERPQPAIRN